MSQVTKRKMRREARQAALLSAGATVSSPRTTRRSAVRRGLMAASAAVVLIAIMFTSPKAAQASVADAPEIDPGSIAGAMTLLVGGVLALTDRARRS